MTKKERKDTLLRVAEYLRAGITQNSQAHTLEAFRWLEDLLSDHGVYSLGEMPRFPAECHVDGLTMMFTLKEGKFASRIERGLTIESLHNCKDDFDYVQAIAQSMYMDLKHNNANMVKIGEIGVRDAQIAQNQKL